ncbi:DNA repair protein REV1 [Coccinella septempunctata]|uniref:DNA repair protein REV1 n=1 Tax=Coccinella septempunctata TaxID=41139 RepID=UPI001D06FD2E|nr:DNA repair protein REV1 [Coccinella septempunctata]
MCERILEGRKRKPKNEEDEAMGFGDFGGYFEAKKSKLVEQYMQTAETTNSKSNIFKGVAIFVNGLTNPNAAELKKLMAEHGGMYHGYQMSTTTHIIASNLAYAKTKNLGSVPIVKASWITDSINLNKLLDYKRYILFSNQSAAQPRLNFPVLQDVKISKEENVVDNNLSSLTVKKENTSVRLDSSSKKNVNELSSNEGSSRISKTASDPEFLEEFFNNSRLHLIATMGAEFKQLMSQLRAKSDGKFIGKEQLLSKGKVDSKRLYSSVVMHIDMDCFFVSVGLRNRPELRGQPVAVTHARNGQISTYRPGRSTEIAMNLERAPENIVEKISNLDSHSSMSEIACCSYEARKCGIKNGMFLGTAVKMCPGLRTIQYDFQGYKEVASILYETVASYTLDIEAVSCDEMYVDVTKLLNETGLTVNQFATHLRSEIMDKTGCPCSTGFGANKLQARLATKKAKPNGQFYLEVDDVEAYFSDIPLGDLPGVGRATLGKLKSLGFHTCGDVQAAPLSLLRSELGQKIGETILEQSRGIDKKPLNFNHERKSVSAEVNYGIRFKTQEECYKFLQSLSQEVFNRLNDIGMRAKCLTLKLMVRAADAPVETAKFLGHGICDSLSKSTPTNITDVKTVFREVKQLYDKFDVPFVDLRGVGIQLSKLEKTGPTNAVMKNFLNQTSVKVEDKSGKDCVVRAPDTVEMNSMQENMKTRPQKQEKRKESPREQNNNASKNKETKSKRGRPPGSKSKSKNNTKSSPSPLLDRYLKNMGTPVKLQKCQNIDLEVLYELPEELRHEIMKEYNINRGTVEMQKKQEKTAKKDTKVEIAKEPSSETTRATSVNSPKLKKNKLFEGLSMGELKRAVQSWLSSEQEPIKIDVELISKHFRQLAMDRRIEDLKIIFNFLHRNFTKMNCKWHEAYFSIVNSMQQGMVSRYGATLMVKRKFPCCW